MDRPDIEAIERLIQQKDLWDVPTIDALQVLNLIAYIKQLEDQLD